MPTEPTAEQDVRFGDVTAPATPWVDVVRVLETAELFWISTVRDGGQPHVTPLPAIWCEDRLHFCTGAEEQKAVNLARNPHVALTTGCNRHRDREARRDDAVSILSQPDDRLQRRQTYQF